MKVDFHWKLIDQIAAPILILDSFGEIRYLNDHARVLLGIDPEVKTTNLDFSQFISQDDQHTFDSSLGEVFDGGSIDGLQICLSHNPGEEIPVSLVGKPLIGQDVNDPQSIWTITTNTGEILRNDQDGNLTKLQDLQWLADQGRNLLSMNDWSEILYMASMALQEKLGDCYVITLTMLDDFNLQMDGIYGIENRLLNQVWKLLGKDLNNNIIPIDDRFRDIYSQRRLYKHPGGLEEFAISQVPEKVSHKLSQMVGLKDIYTIGLEGKQEVLGCFYIFTINDRLPVGAELVESFAFQVALALDKSKYARELEISENQFQTIFEFAPDGYYISDTQGKFLNLNLATEKITGYPKEELIGKGFLDAGLLSKSQIPLAGALFLEGLAGKPTGPTEFNLNRKDGSVVTVEVSSYPVKIGDQSVILGIARDISHRRQTEEDLHIAHKSLTRVLEGIDAHVYVADIDTFEILYMNKRMIEDYGGNFVGKLCHKVFGNSNSPCSHCSNPNLINNLGEPGEVYVWEGQNKKNGKWYRNYDRAIYWTGQRLVRMQIAVDITENKIAANSLQQSEKRYRSLFETSHNAIMTISPPEWRFTSGNPAMIEVFGLEDESQFVSLQPWQLSPEYQPDGQLSTDMAREMIDIAVETGSNFFPWTHKRLDGDDFPATVQLKRVDIEDRYFLQATVRDISDDVRAEKLLQQKMDDLELINKLNTAVNQDNGTADILDLFSLYTTKLIDSSHTSILELSDDGKELSVKTRMLNPLIQNLLGNISGVDNQDQISINIEEMALFKECLEKGESRVISKPADIQQVLADMAAATPFPEIVKSGMKKMTREFISRLEIISLMVLPIVSGDKKFGLVFIPGTKHFSEEDLHRLSSITGQLSAVMYRVDVDHEKREKSKETDFIYRTLVEGSRIDDIDELCDHLAKSVREINPDVFLAVSLFDPDLDAIRIRSIKGLGKFGTRISKVLGVKPEEFTVNTSHYYLDDELNKLYTSGKLEIVPGGIYDLTRGKLSKRLCRSIEKMTGVSEVKIIGFSKNDKSNGGLILFLKEGDKIILPEAIETVVSQYSIILDRRMSQQEVVQRKTQLEALRVIELEIASDLDIESLLQSISEKATAIVDASACGFSIYNPDRNVLEYTAYTGFDELPEVTDVYPGEGLSGRVWETRETLTVHNYSEWDGRLENWTEVSNYYLAGIPVSWGDEILGVLEVALDPNNSLSINQLETLELFATQAAIALKNARLFRDEKLRRNEADTLREIGVLINRMIGEPELLDMILSSLQKVVSYSSASIQLVSGSEIVVEAYFGDKPVETIVGTTFKIQENEAARKILIDGENIILGSEVDVRGLLDGPNIGEVEILAGSPPGEQGSQDWYIDA